MEEFTTAWVRFRARGHPNVRATHRTTLEITRETHLTPRGDCIIAVESEIGLADLPASMKHEIRSGGLVVLAICARGICDSVAGWGSPELGLSDPDRIIIRRSTYTDSRTLMIRASKAARYLDRRLIRELQAGAEAEILISVIPRRRLGLRDRVE